MDWEKKFAKCTSDKGLVSKYMKFSEKCEKKLKRAKRSE